MDASIANGSASTVQVMMPLSLLNFPRVLERMPFKNYLKRLESANGCLERVENAA